MGAACASRAAFGNLVSSSSSVLVVNMRAPAGWMIDFVGSWMSAKFDGAFGCRSDTFAAESTNAVVFRFGGLVQPDIENILFAKLRLTSSSI